MRYKPTTQPSLDTNIMSQVSTWTSASSAKIEMSIKLSQRDFSKHFIETQMCNSSARHLCFEFKIKVGHSQSFKTSALFLHERILTKYKFWIKKT